MSSSSLNNLFILLTHLIYLKSLIPLILFQLKFEF